MEILFPLGFENRKTYSNMNNIDILMNTLEFIKNEKFHLYKDGTWYSHKSEYKTNKKMFPESIQYTTQDLATLVMKSNIRKKFKEEVFSRDNHTCFVCKTKRVEEELDAHHITDRSEMPNGGYVKENGITVCKFICHMKVEEFHITKGEVWDENLHPDDLYKAINSSKELAIEKSHLL